MSGMHRWTQMSLSAALVAVVCAGVALGQSDAPPVGAQPAAPEPAVNTPAENLIRLSEGMRAYAEGDADKAREIFTALRRTDPTNPACLYYLGLIYLRDGLNLSASGDVEGAKKAFSDAQECFEIVVKTADPRVRPVEAAVNLGIAQLGRSDVDIESLKYAEKAADLLKEYLATPDGSADRFGYFFLGVASFRMARQTPEPYARQAVVAFDEALRVAREAQDRGELTPPEYSDFELRVLYYKGLIKIVGRDRQSARSALSDVAERSPSSKLGSNANELIRMIDEAEQSSPAPLSFDSPVGRVEVEGFMNLGQYYDTNEILLGYDTDLPLKISQPYDYRFGLEGGFDIRRRFTEADGIVGKSLLVGAGGTTSHFWGPNVQEFDINTYSGRAYVNWEPVSDLFLGIDYTYTYTKLGYEPYISSNRISPVVTKLWRDSTEEERARTDLFYSYEDRDYFDKYFDKRLDRDGNYHSIGLAQSFNLWKARELWRTYYKNGPENEKKFDAERWLQLKLGYLYRNERTQGDEFDLWGHTASAGVDVPLPLRLAFDFTAALTWDHYTQPSLFDYRGNYRSDMIQYYTFGLSRILVARGECKTLRTLEIKGRAGIDLFFQDSNIWDRRGQDLYSFDRQIYSLTLAISF